MNIGKWLLSSCVVLVSQNSFAKDEYECWDKKDKVEIDFATEFESDSDIEGLSDLNLHWKGESYSMDAADQIIYFGNALNWTADVTTANGKELRLQLSKTTSKYLDLVIFRKGKIKKKYSVKCY